MTVVETLDVPGGCCRSGRFLKDQEIPSEYSWHGIGPWYHNTKRLLQTIPLTASRDSTSKTVGDNLAGTIRFQVLDALEELPAPSDVARMAWYFTKVATSDQRSSEVYSQFNAAKLLREKLESKKLAHEISWTFGPWVGTDASHASYHHVAKFFQKNWWPGTESRQWKTFNGPSNEVWFAPWVKFLQHKGVAFLFNHTLEKIEWDEREKVVTNVVVKNDLQSSSWSSEPPTIKKIKADTYVLAISPYATRKVLHRTPQLVASDAQLKLFDPLTRDQPHIQISFRLAFDELICFPKNSANSFIFNNSEYNITMCIQNILWEKNIYLGAGVKSLWSGTACLSDKPGKLFNLPMSRVTREQFIAEIKHQLRSSKNFDEIIRTNNRDQGLDFFLDKALVHFEVWHSWHFVGEENISVVKETEPKWVNTTNTQPYQPTNNTSTKNLFLGGAHVKTSTELWSIEAAVESGQRVADLISKSNTVLTQPVPMLFKTAQVIDNELYRHHLPQFLSSFALIVLLSLVIFCALFFPHHRKVKETHKTNEKSLALSQLPQRTDFPRLL